MAGSEEAIPEAEDAAEVVAAMPGLDRVVQAM
jgi:hypothetical protein